MRQLPKRFLKAAYEAIPQKRRLFELLRPLKMPPELYQHLHFSGPFTVRRDGIPMFQMHANHEILENELFWSGYAGTWERTSLKVWHRLSALCRGWILDIGANTGAYALAAHAANKSARVVAFEPVRRTADRLRKNIALNHFPVQVEQRAASDRSGLATLHDATRGDVNYTASLEAGHGENTVSYDVETISIDDYLAAKGWPRVDLLKIDVETHEPAVIRGMAETISRFSPAILIEVLFLKQGREIAEAVAGGDYLLFNVDEEGGCLIPTDTLQHIHGASWNNLLCTAEQFESAGLADFVTA